MMNMCLVLIIIINFVLIETGALPLNSNCGICISNGDGVADCSRTYLTCVRVFSKDSETIREVYVSRCSQKIYPRKWQKYTKKLGPGNAESCYGSSTTLWETTPISDPGLWSARTRKKITTETPSKKITTETPRKKTTTETPRKKTTTETPRKKITTETPRKKTTTETPRKKTTTETPRKKITTETPRKKTTTETPRKKTTTETPRKKITTETPRKKITTETPRKKTTTETPRKKITTETVQTPENIFDEREVTGSSTTLWETTPISDPGLWSARTHKKTTTETVQTPENIFDEPEVTGFFMWALATTLAIILILLKRCLKKHVHCQSCRYHAPPHVSAPPPDAPTENIEFTIFSTPRLSATPLSSTTDNTLQPTSTPRTDVSTSTPMMSVTDQATSVTDLTTSTDSKKLLLYSPIAAHTRSKMVKQLKF